MPPSSRMNPKPLSMRSRAIVPVGIAVSSDDAKRSERSCASVGKSQLGSQAPKTLCNTVVCGPSARLGTPWVALKGGRLHRSTLVSGVLGGIILAAGNSTRMGKPKALLDAPAGHTFVTWIVRTWYAAHVPNIVVVTGRDHDRIVAATRQPASPQPPPLIVQNVDPSRGQLSSLLVGLNAIDAPAIDGVLM